MYIHRMERMVRKQVYLTTEQDRRLRQAARKHRRTEAEIVRQALDRELGTDFPAADPADDSLWGLVGIADGGPSDVSERVDEYLYGRPKK
jgi:hypothetical protein